MLERPQSPEPLSSINEQTAYRQGKPSSPFEVRERGSQPELRLQLLHPRDRELPP